MYTIQLKMMSKFLFLLAGIGLLAGCSKDDDGPTPNAANIQLKQDATFGSYLTDSDGKTLYFFSKDVNGESACQGACLDAWPLFYEKELVTGTGLDNNDFGVISHPDGQKQTTFRGWPLYFFSQDAALGEFKGDARGNNWYVAKTDYELMIGEQTIDSNSERYLTDSEGNTLYVFTNDETDQSNCNDNCAQAWPPYNPQNIVVPSILKAADFTTITRADGSKQLAFKGQPLYYFAQDQQRGDVNGQGVGNSWFILKESDLQ